MAATMALAGAPAMIQKPTAAKTLAGRPAAARIAGRRMRVMASATATTAQRAEVKSPELEQIGLPMNTFGPKNPFIGKVVSVKTLTGPKATGETCEIIIQTDKKIPFVEGQSYGVIPPGTKINSKGKEVPHGTRLYSIASTRYGESFDGMTATLCVRRAVFVDPETGKEDPAKKGICSNFLCDAKPGQEITMTGPTGKVLLLPEDTSLPIICVATGTGIAPFRTFWRRMFLEKVPGYEFKGLFWMFMGVANSDAKLYDEEMQSIAAAYPDQFRLDYALSREQKNKRGGKMYIQDKGMMPGILEMLERVATEKGLNWTETFEKLKHNNQFHVEVY